MSGSLFDIIGPVMVGPSSSHTAGAVRLSQLARLIAGQEISVAECILYNSFAHTYRGHGTDRGLIAGLLGFTVDDERIRTAFEEAENMGLQYSITPDLGHNHFSPNTVRFNLTLADGEQLMIIGHSVGGGKVYVSKVNQYNVSLKGDMPTVILFYKDQPGMIWQVTKVIAEQKINIASLQCARKRRGVEAFMSIALDENLAPEQVQAIKAIPDVFLARSVDRLP